MSQFAIPIVKTCLVVPNMLLEGYIEQSTSACLHSAFLYIRRNLTYCIPID